MYKPLADSTLMNMTKKEIIEHFRIAEHNHKVAEQMNNQIKEEGLTDAYLLGKYDGIKQGRADAIDECINTLKDFCGGLPNNNLINALEQLKEKNNE